MMGNDCMEYGRFPNGSNVKYFRTRCSTDSRSSASSLPLYRSDLFRIFGFVAGLFMFHETYIDEVSAFVFYSFDFHVIQTLSLAPMEASVSSRLQYDPKSQRMISKRH